MSVYLSPGTDNAEQPFKLWRAVQQLENPACRTPWETQSGRHLNDEALGRKAWCALKRGRSLCVEAATGWEVLLL